MENIVTQTKRITSTLNEAIREKAPFAFCSNYGEILFAEKEGYIKRDWRKSVDVVSGVAMVKENNDLLVGQWLQAFESLRKLLEFSGRFGWEEVMKILSDRSSLENSWEFIPDEDKAILRSNYRVDMVELDLSLTSVLARESAHTESCRGRKNLGFDSSNTHHWWWFRNSA